MLKKLKRLAKDFRSSGEGDFWDYMNLAKEKLGEGASFYDVSDAYYAYSEAERLAVNKKKQQHKRISGEDYITATQFFTPGAICEYLSANCIHAMCCNSRLKGERFLDNKTQSGRLDISDVKIIDPALGTGNLLYATAVMILRGLCRGGMSEAEAKAITASRICGLDLDAKAVAFAGKRLEKLLGRAVDVVVIPSVDEKLLKKLSGKVSEELIEKLRNLSISGALESFSEGDVESLKALATKRGFAGKLDGVIAVAELLCKKYDIVLLNPPYLSSSDYGDQLDKRISNLFPNYRADLFAAFTVRALELLQDGGLLGLVAPYNWMFLHQFEELRRCIIEKHSVKNLVKLPSEGYMRAVVYLSAAVIEKGMPGESGSFIDIPKVKNAEDAMAIACGGDVENKYEAKVTEFAGYPGGVYAFWLGKAGDNFEGKKLADVLEIRQGLATGNNKKFLRLLKEVDSAEVDFTSENMDAFVAGGKKYALYNKGGKFRKWYGNRTYVIDFSPEAREKLAVSGNHMPSKGYYFKRGVTWTLVSSKGVFGARLSESSVFDVGGSCGFPKNPQDIYVILAYLCSKVATFYLSALNPTVNTQVGDIKNLPYTEPDPSQKAELTELAKGCVALAKQDWEEEVPTDCAPERRAEMKAKEERINEIFIKLYNLQDRLSPLVEDKLITLK